MTDSDRALPGLLTPEATPHRLVDQLAVRFAGIFARETIDRYVFESYTALARTATVTTRVPVLAGRFATERLTAPATGILHADEEDLADVAVDGALGLGQRALLADLHLAGASR